MILILLLEDDRVGFWKRQFGFGDCRGAVYGGRGGGFEGLQVQVEGDWSCPQEGLAEGQHVGFEQFYFRKERGGGN